MRYYQRIGDHSPIITAHSDTRFDSKKHFIKTDINADFLKKHGIEVTIKQFKKTLAKHTIRL